MLNWQRFAHSYAMSPRYLVTGAAGFIGSALAQALLQRGDAVRGIDNFATGKRENLSRCPGLEFIEGDLGDPEAAGVKRVIYAASSSAYGNSPTLPKREDFLPAPLSPYAVAKLAGEHYLAAFHACYGMTTVSIRYFNVFGPYQDAGSAYAAVLAKFITAMLAGEAPQVHGDGEQSRDFTYIDNVVAANLLAAAAPAEKVAGQMMNVATGTRVTLNQVLELLRPMLNYQGPVHYGPPRAGDVQHSLADISRAQQLLGYQPHVSFEAGLARTVDWYRSLGRGAGA
jgi:UDP-glucose 4-epimerase